MAAAAKGNTVLLVLGLVISIPLIIYGSTLVLKLMERFGFIVVMGAGLLGWVAGEMLVTDPAVSDFVETQARWSHTAVPVLATMIVVTTGMWFARRSRDMTPLAVAIPAEGGNRPTEMPLDTNTYLVGREAAAEVSPHVRVAHHVEVHRRPDAPADPVAKNPSGGADAVDVVICADFPPAEAPVGYRWHANPWRTLDDGTRDYALLHGKHAFYRLVPDSGRVRRQPH